MTVLLFGVHAHQPVGNFPEVIARARDRCYRPFLETLDRFPAFRFSIHFSGWLLEWLARRYPEDIDLLRRMVARGQAEIFGSGWSEPVLAAIPHRDRVGQLEAMSAQLERLFGTRPRGAWLTERVWESSVVPALGAAGIRYATVDDYHFLCTGKTSRDLDAYYTTEEDGAVLDVFPIAEALRYRLPFSLAHEALAFIERLDEEGRSAAIYFDDIEKFGVWPGTWEWVYEKGWLEQFLAAVLASPRVRTATYREYHSTAKSRGIVYLPTTSYNEMNEWTLPASAAGAYARLVREHKDSGRYDETRAFLRGGIWHNFLTRYPEANWMHKRMLGLSARLAALPPGERSEAMTRDLYCAQANDAYWHGLFGGLYLPHLRRSVYRNLLKLEAALDAAAPRPSCAPDDADLDGAREFFLRAAELQAVVRDDGLGVAHELASYPLAHNFADTLRRGAEAYYARIGQPAADGSPPQGGIASPHDRLPVAQGLSADDFVADAAPRALFLDRYLTPDGGTQAISGYTVDGADPAQATLALRAPVAGGVIRKRYEAVGSRLRVTYAFEGISEGSFATQLNLSFPAGDGFGGRYVLADGTIPCGFGQELAQSDLIALTLDDRELGGSLRLAASMPLALRAGPHHTVSQSEAGLEKIMQAVTLELIWPLNSGRATVVAIELAVRSDR